MIDCGIKIKTNTEAKEFIVENNRITKILTNNEEISNIDLVVCNADPPMVYSKLLKKQNLKRPVLKEKNLLYSMGLFVLFFGTKKQYHKVAHHTIWMTERFKSLLHDIFKNKILSEDFSLYIHRPTATDKSFAPEGCDSFYVLCPVPNLQGNVDWDSESENLKDKIVKELSKTIMPDLEKNITDVFWMNPKDFKNDYNSMHGAGFSIAPIFTQSAWFRYHNKDKKRVKEAINKIKIVGGLDFAEKKMEGYRVRALQILNDLPDSPYRKSLELMVNYVIERTI